MIKAAMDLGCLDLGCVSVSDKTSSVGVSDALEFLSSASKSGLSSNHGITAGTAYGQASRPTGMGPQPVPIGGGAEHQRYSVEDEAIMRLKAERAPRAGGFSLEISKRRALEEAFASIWV